MYMMVHERNAPNNAFSIEMTLYKHIQKLGIDFFHPKWSQENKVDLDGEEFPMRIGKLEADLDSAIQLRDALTAAIDEIQAFRIKELEGALLKAKTLDGERLQHHCEAFVSGVSGDDEQEIEEKHCSECGLGLPEKHLVDEEGIRFFCDQECQTEWYFHHGQDEYGNDVDSD